MSIHWYSSCYIHTNEWAELNMTADIHLVNCMLQVSYDIMENSIPKSKILNILFRYDGRCFKSRRLVSCSVPQLAAQWMLPFQNVGQHHKTYIALYRFLWQFKMDIILQSAAFVCSVPQLAMPPHSPPKNFHMLSEDRITNVLRWWQ